MPAFSAAASGKIILFGEHAVVYGRPAIAVPVDQVQTRAVVIPQPGFAKGMALVQAPDIGYEAMLEDIPPDHPLGAVFRLLLHELNIQAFPAVTVRITSTIPQAAGLGSGAAVSVAIVKALAGFLGKPLSDERVSALAYEVEKLHHGTPSGIDNTVIAYHMPTYFIKGAPIETFQVEKRFTIVIGDTGIKSPTGLTVSDLRKSWLSDPGRYELIFDEIGHIVNRARALIESGNPEGLGVLMVDNHRLLKASGVSSDELDRLVDAAGEAGALGAKLSGGGRGGNMIALVDADRAAQVADTLVKAGAVRTIITEIR